jgi:hypothetical protein
LLTKKHKTNDYRLLYLPESLCVADLGVRYMFNNKFGLKSSFGYNNFEGKKQFS